MEETSPVKDSDSYSIVIVGAMNPAIHHPAWYHQIQLLGESESQNPSEVIVTPVLAQFAVTDLAISCTTDRWIIKTERSESVEKLLSFTCTVFDVLNQTPISAFGFNFDYHRHTSLATVGVFLAERVATANLGLKDDAESADIRVRHKQGGRRITVTVQPSKSGPQFIFIGTNYHYEIADLNLPSHFDLSPPLREHYSADRSESKTELSRILSTVGA